MDNGSFNVDKSLIFGMTDLSGQETNVDYHYTHRLFDNMGVKSVRVWMHCNWFMNSPTEISPSGYAKMQGIYNDLKDRGLQIIAMNHSNFHKTGLINSASTTAKPGRDLTEGSYYLEWLNDLETTYYNMVKCFPDIEYWEIDNECNNDDFMPQLGSSVVFTLEEKAEIFYDMLFYASRGIHRANPKAKTVMGGLVVWNAQSFLNLLYDLIYKEGSWSNNPDDYFQVACWHPYMETFTKSKFIKLNDEIYDVVRSREGKDKKVFLTEVGFSEGAGFTKEETAEYIKTMYETARDKLYYVESMHYFRMYDDYSSTWGSTAEKYFGLYYDPVYEKEGETVKKAEPKPGALAFKDVAGGKGDLNVYMNFLDGEYETKIVMHRGYSAIEKENTVAAFSLAGQQEDVYAIETDVYLTKDNKAIIMHDDSTERVTFGQYCLKIKESTFDELRAIRLPDGNGVPNKHQIPSLKEYLDVLNKYNKVGFLELKENFSKEQLKLIYDELIENIDLDRIVTISFHKDALIAFREMYPNAKAMLLVNNINETSIEFLKQYNLGFDCEINGVTFDLVDILKNEKIDVNLWCVDSKDLADQCGRRSVTYMTTNSITSFKNKD